MKVCGRIHAGYAFWSIEPPAGLEELRFKLQFECDRSSSSELPAVSDPCDVAEGVKKAMANANTGSDKDTVKVLASFHLTSLHIWHGIVPSNIPSPEGAISAKYWTFLA